MIEAADPKTLINGKGMVRQIKQLIDDDTTIFAETGDSWFNGVQMDLRRGAKFEAQMQWSHIGWSATTCLAYSVGAKDEISSLWSTVSHSRTALVVSLMTRL
ncbi:uncharacterized protein ZBAI_05057 [Zygosaccharomyces bailii ISA1307]|nr:uncharacterized protein ZBAI_05057 [Zygosaccharomyces bailii ISA1307]